MSKFHSSFVSFGRVQVSDVFTSKLFKYAIDGRVKKIGNLLSSCKDKNYDIDARNTRGQTPLFAACMLGHYKIVLLLLQLGANPNRRSDDGSTPTHAAAFSCNTNVLQIICEYGGDLRLHDDRDLLPRDWSVEAGPKRNKKILELIDCWQNEVLSHVDGHKSSENCKKPSTSVTKLWKFNVSDNAGNTSDHHNTTSTSMVAKTQQRPPSSITTTQPVFNSAFGNFSVLNMTGQKIDLCQTQQMGFSALIPIINPDQLSEAHNEESIAYQSAPHFLLSNGYWGNQAITKKKARESKRRILRHMASTRDLMMREVQFLGLVRHANILTLLAACVGKCRSDKNGESASAELLSPYTLVFEHISYGSLYGLLHENNKQLFPISLNITSTLRYLQQISNALEFIHQRGYAHCCVTSHSVHIINLYTAKLSDFYYSMHVDDTNGISTPISSAFNRWLAPELLADKKPSIKCDVYSYGVVLCEATSGTLPWRGYDVESIRYQVVTKGKKFPLPEATPVDLLPVLRESMEISRRKRNIKLQEISYFIKKLVSNYSRCLDQTPKYDGREVVREKRNPSIGGGNDPPIVSSTSLILQQSPPDYHTQVEEAGVDVVDAAPCYHSPNDGEIRRNFYEKSSSLNTSHHRRFGSHRIAAPSSSSCKLKKRYSLPPDHALETAATVQSFSYGKDTRPYLQGEGELPTMQHDSSISPVNNYNSHRKPESQNRSTVGDGDHVGDESAGLVHPILMDSDSFDSSLAESYGYHRRNTDDDTDVEVPACSQQQHNKFDNNRSPPPAHHQYDDDDADNVIVHHVGATNATAMTTLSSLEQPSQQQHIVRREKSATRVTAKRVEISPPPPPPPPTTIDYHDNRTYNVEEEDEIRRYAQQETQTEEQQNQQRRRTPSVTSSEGRETLMEVVKSSSLNRCDGFRSTKRKPIYVKRSRNKRTQFPSKVGFLNMKRKSMKKVNRSVSDPLHKTPQPQRETTDKQEEHRQILEVVPEQRSATEHQSDDDGGKKDESIEIQETVDRVHNSLVELSRMLTTSPTNNHRNDDNDVMQPRQRSVTAHPNTSTTTDLCSNIAVDSSQTTRVVHEDLILPTHVTQTEDVTILTDDDATSSCEEKEQRPPVVRKMESLSDFAIEVIDACGISNYFPAQRYKKQRAPLMTSSAVPPTSSTIYTEEDDSSDDDVMMTSCDSRKRRFSLGSSDLEDLYSKFADRKSFYREADDDGDDVGSQRTGAVAPEPRRDDDSDDDIISLAPSCGGGTDDDGSYSGGKSPSLMFAMYDDEECDVTGAAAAAPPRVDEVDDVTGCDVTGAPSPRVEEVDDVTGRDVIALRRVNSCIEAQAPPQLEDFISATANSTYTTGPLQIHQQRATVHRSKSDCAMFGHQKTKSKKIQVGHSSFHWMTSQSLTKPVAPPQPHDKLFSYLSIKPGGAVIPASHMPPIRNYTKATSSPAGDVITSMPQTPKSSVVGQMDADFQLDVTPSKWSFKMKRDVFEGANVTGEENKADCDVTAGNNNNGGGVVMTTTPVNPPHLVAMLLHEKGVKTSTPLDRHDNHRAKLLTPNSAPGACQQSTSVARRQHNHEYLDESCFPSGTEQISDIQKCSGYEGGGGGGESAATSNGSDVSDKAASGGGSEHESSGSFSGISYDDSDVKSKSQPKVEEVSERNQEDQEIDLNEEDQDRDLNEEDQRRFGEEEQRSLEDIEEQRSLEEHELDEERDSTSIWVESNEEDEQLQQVLVEEEEEISDDDDD